MCQTWTLTTLLPSLPPVNKTSASNNTPEHDVSAMEARWLSPHSWRHNSQREQWAASVVAARFISQICPGRGVDCIYIYECMCVWTQRNTPLRSHKGTLSPPGQRHLIRTKETKYDFGARSPLELWYRKNSTRGVSGSGKPDTAAHIIPATLHLLHNNYDRYQWKAEELIWPRSSWR